tara:strand:+ start:294 stop:521 length:228 start_codon:yes stop_codon:yes gene_type:complete
MDNSFFSQNHITLRHHCLSVKADNPGRNRSHSMAADVDFVNDRNQIRTDNMRMVQKLLMRNFDEKAILLETGDSD